MNNVSGGQGGGMNPSQLRALAAMMANELRRPGAVGAMGGRIPPRILCGDRDCCVGVNWRSQEELATALGRIPAAQLRGLWDALGVVAQWKTALKQW